MELHQKFKRAVIAYLPRNRPWTITDEIVRNFIEGLQISSSSGGRMKIILATAALAALIGSARAESGIASRYWTREQGTRTASGRPLRDGALTAAHKSLPFGSRVRVTNRANGRSVVVTITDRGPYVRGRIIDLTNAACRALGFSALAHVTVERVAKDL